jgi:ATP-dependent protease ClpP protease subunit
VGQIFIKDSQSSIFDYTMAKELLLYSGIYSFVAEEIINALEEFSNDNVILRVNSGGGDVQATWGIIAKVIEHGNVTMKVDGVAMSSAANLLMYADKVEALDVSTFMFHRAAYSYGGDSAEEKAFLAKVNTDLRKRMEAKIDSSKLKEMKGVTVADLFEKEERITLFLTASEMKQLGVVSKINKINPTEIKAFNEMYLRIAAEHTPPTQNKPVMTLAELKEKHPTVYAEAVAEGRTIGADAEFDRVNAALVFNHLDPKGVKEIIASKKPMTATQMAEFSLKAASPAAIAAAAGEAPVVVKTAEVIAAEAKTAHDLEIEAYEKDIKASLKENAKPIAFVKTIIN